VETEVSKNIASSLTYRSGYLGCHPTREKTRLPEMFSIGVFHSVTSSCHDEDPSEFLKEGSKKETTLEMSSCSSDFILAFSQQFLL